MISEGFAASPEDAARLDKKFDSGFAISVAAGATRPVCAAKNLGLAASAVTIETPIHEAAFH